MRACLRNARFSTTTGFRDRQGEWPQVLNLTEEHGNLLKLVGQPYMQLYDVKYS